MKPRLVNPCIYAKGEIELLGDKSIATRALIISSLSNAKTSIQNFPPNKDCLSTISVLQKLGILIKIKSRGNVSPMSVTVFGRGPLGFKKPKGPIFVGESGTTFRLILGILAGQNFGVTLTAGKSLSERPMLRVTEPLRMMGAKINAKRKTQNAKREEYPPITIKGGALSGITYRLPVASAQVKSAILLAGLYAQGTTVIIEPSKSRDHSERMLKLFKADIKTTGNKIVIRGDKKLSSPKSLTIPGDISSAAFFMVLAAILPKPSSILIRNVSLNPTRCGIIKALKKMNASISIDHHQIICQGEEPRGDISVTSSNLKGINLSKKDIPSLIDELPVLMVAASLAQGKSIFEGVSELRVKETDRIKSMVENLSKMKADIKVIKSAKSEKIVIHGVAKLKGAPVRCFKDHRTAMSMVIAGLAAEGPTRIDDSSCIDKSFPNFLKLARSVTR